MTTYGTLYVLAMLSGLGVYLVLATRRHGVALGAAYRFAAVVVGGAWCGAQLAGALTHAWNTGALVVPALQGGTGASWGGILGGLGAGVWLRRRTGRAGSALLAAAVPAIPVVQAIGRIGCYVAGCDYGTPAADLAWSVTYGARSAVPDALLGVALHPVQLYEAAACALLACVLVVVVRRGTSGLHAAGTYATLYAVARLVIEVWRGDVDRGALPGLPLSLVQALALGWLALVASTSCAAYRRRHAAAA